MLVDQWSASHQQGNAEHKCTATGPFANVTRVGELIEDLVA